MPLFSLRMLGASLSVRVFVLVLVLAGAGAGAVERREVRQTV